jgi:hypothetical protein
MASKKVLRHVTTGTQLMGIPVHVTAGAKALVATV